MEKETKETTIQPKTVDPAKLKQLNIAVETLEKQFGKGAIMRLGDDSPWRRRSSTGQGD